MRHNNMPLHIFLVCVFSMFTIVTMPIISFAAEQPVVLPDVVVVKTENKDLTVQPPEPGSGTQELINKKTISVQGGAAQISPYKAISLQLGVDISSKDAFGMEISHRIRGKSDRNVGETLEGLPLKGIGPGVGLSTMVDLENLEAITLTKGAVPADSGFGYGSDNGVVDMHIKGPTDEFHATVKQVFGENRFSRSYARIDTGSLGDVAKAFISTSYTDAEKWKGAGESPDGRKNTAFGLTSVHQAVEWELYGIYNEDNKHAYRGLSYDQTRNLSKYLDFDYTTTLTGDSSQDIYYYNYNKQHFETYTLFGKIKVPLSNSSSITFKPYYLKDKGHSYSGSNGKVIDWVVDHDTYGAVLEYQHDITNGEIKFGYWYQEDEPPGPPTSKKYLSTDNLSFISWERLVEGTNHKFNSPYIVAKKKFGAMTVNAGVRYLWLTSPDWTSYKTTGLPNVSYEKALSMVDDSDIMVDVDGKTYGVFLPNIAANYQFSNALQVRASYGRNYNTPQYGLGSAIIKYAAKGLTDDQLEDIWHGIEPETSDNVDLGIIYSADNWFVSPTLYYSLVKHVGLSFYDPDLAFSYSQNVGEAQSYGIEVALGYTFSPRLNTSLSLSYNHYEFTSDIIASGGSVIAANGHQIPNVPLFMANLSANWEIYNVMVTPTIRYLGKRYADVENKYSVDSNVVVDLFLSRKIDLANKQSLTLGLGGTNLLDEEYIAIISAGDTSIGQDSPTYYPGAPRTIFASLQYDF